MSEIEQLSQLRDWLNTQIIGQHTLTERLLLALLADGHLLVEGAPGLAKTRAIKTLSDAIEGSFQRIQFTPGLLPGDVTGITVYDQKKGEFEFHMGPIFANVVLADEINRASPKTQSALLEVMEEGQVTVDGVTRPVGTPFLVVATQNPVEQAGTYRLPEAQLDRFLLKTSLGYPDHAATLKILEGTATAKREVAPVITPQGVVTMADIAREVYLNPLVLDYISRLVEATRNATQVRLGVSVRGALALTKASKTWAAAHGRSYVTPDDVKALAEPVLAHRLILDPEAEFDGVTANAVIGQVLLDTVPPSQRESA